MNYLAHALLSSYSEQLQIGNFIADHLRGNNFSHLPTEIIAGVHMHRQIDYFTDNHAIFKASKRFFYKDFEKYSGILIDIYFDHLLARNFENYFHLSLSTFSSEVYAIYQRHIHHLPDSSQRFLGYVISNNVYESYAKQTGITTVLEHLSKRINHGVRLNDSISVFLKHEQELEENFSFFFQDIQTQFKGE